MQKLNLPPCSFRFKSNEKHTFIFDKLRKKYIVLTPEEWVRQHFVQFLIDKKKYPASLIALEKQFTINNLKKRTDIIVFDSSGNPNIIVECKAPEIKITQTTFDQIARYNLKLNANYLIITNGLEHYFYKMDFSNKTYVFLDNFPEYRQNIQK